MRFHTDRITTADLYRAAERAGVGFTRLEEHGSRKRDHAFDFILTGSSPRRQNTRGMTDDHAATWDEWGIFLNDLFAVDPNAWTESYHSAEHFIWATGNRYLGFGRLDQHINHKWEFSGRSATGAYMVHECACGAIRRFTDDFEGRVLAV